MKKQFVVLLFSLLSVVICFPQKQLGIVNGHEVEPNSLPYQVYLGIHFGDGDSKPCGGTLISRNYVLTSARCSINEYSFVNATSVTVILGLHKISNYSEETRQTFVSSEFIVYPYRIVPSEHDIALVKLPYPANLTDAVQTVKLPSRESVNSSLVGTTGVISGWGYTQDQGLYSNVLRSAEVTVVDSAICEDSNAILRSLHKDYEYCVDSSSGFCDGDEGGPMVSNGTIIGIPTEYIYCSVTDPQVYVDVSKFLDWIADNSDVVV